MRRVSGFLASAMLAGACGASGPSDMPPRPVTAEARDALFVLEVAAAGPRYPPGVPIEVWTQLTYLGPGEAIRVGHGDPIVVVSLEQLDGPLDPGGSGSDVCWNTRLVAQEPLQLPYQKSGGWSNTDPNAALLRAFFDDPLLRLQPGIYRFTAYADFFEQECGADRPRHQLEAAIDITVGG